jgi:hypothetical protein
MTLEEEKEKLLREIWALEKDNNLIFKQQMILSDRRDLNTSTLREIKDRIKQIDQVYGNKKK